MHSKKTVLIVDLMNAANMELIRLDFRSSALSRHDKEFRRFCNYCTENGIQTYDAETGPRYFRSRFGLNIGDANIKLNRQQLDARNSIRFLDDIFQFGYPSRKNGQVNNRFSKIFEIFFLTAFFEAFSRDVPSDKRLRGDIRQAALRTRASTDHQKTPRGSFPDLPGSRFPRLRVTF